MTRRIDFMIAGVQKGGTTSLDAYLRQHPGISMAKKKAAKKNAGKKRVARAPVQHADAEDQAKQQRQISVSEFFAKNSHLLGFDNPSKALLTTVKEGVDNSLDACEEAGILPDIGVEIEQLELAQ